MRWLPISQTSRLPSPSNTRLCGWRSRAFAPGPPSPPNPVAAVPAFAVAGDCCQPLRRKIEAPDALVVEIAEVQGAVGSDHQAVRIVHLRFGIAGHAGADERGHGRRRGATSIRGEEKRNEENSRGHGCGGIILYAMI